MKLSYQIKDFFESYEVANELSDKKGILVTTFESANKDLLQIKIVEKALKQQRGVGQNSSNMFCDIKVEGTIVNITFKFNRHIDDEIKRTIKMVVNGDYLTRAIGNQLVIKAIDPRINEVKKIFMELEQHCRRFE